MPPALPLDVTERASILRPERTGHGIMLSYGVVALIVAAVLAIGVTVWHMRRDALEAAWANTDNLTTVLAEQTARSVQAVDIVIREVQEHIGGIGPATPDDFKRMLATEPIQQFLRSRVDRLPQVDHLSLIAADGARVNYSIGWPVESGDLSDRSYLRHFAAVDDPGLFVSEPVVSRATHIWTIFFGRRINGRDGRFLGVVLAAMPLRVFTSLYESFNLHSESFMLLRSDGTILARHPDTASNVGRRMPPASPWFGLVARGGGFYLSPGYFDGAARLVAVRPLRSYPLVVDVGTLRDAALLHWRQMSILIGCGTAVAAGLLLLLVSMLRRQLQRLEQSRAALRLRNAELTEAATALQQSEQRLDTKSHELDATLAAMDQGLMMVDGAGTLAVCNTRAIELLNLPPSMASARPLLGELVAHHAADGTFALLRDTLCESAPAAAVLEPLPPAHCSEHHLANGRILEVRCVRLDQGGVVATVDDVTTRRQAERQVAFLARHDPLTRLPNRTAFVEQLDQAIAHAGRGSLAAVLCLDLDHFKEVNDTLGHPIGDCLLRAVADRLAACVREVDVVARFGGDEFAVVQRDAERVEDVALLARRIIEVLRLPYDLDGHQILIGASLGVALIPADGADADTLLKNADIALYRAKFDGRGVFRFFAPAMDARLQERRQLELDLQHALMHQEFELFYQPLIELAQERVCGFEALLRWHHPSRGLLLPAAFVPLAEEMGLIVSLGEWALHDACRAAVRWPDGVRVAVNLSPVQFRYRDLVPMVVAALRDSGLPARRLELEVTEAALLHNSDDVFQTLHDLRALGVLVSMDDFGTGHSSLSYLRRFPFNRIKIHESFIRELPQDGNAAAIVRAIASLGNALGMATTAEGVETGAQLARLRAEGCTEVQGFLFSQPRPAEDLPRLLQQLRRQEAGQAA